jgi:hypothetical protein
MNADETITRCPSCDGYGWSSDEFSGETGDCEWCEGTGYVYRSAAGLDRPIPAAEYGQVAAVLERLEHDRLHEMGYSGQALHPDDQPVRKPPPPLEEE